MRLISRLVLRHRARQSVLNALRFAERLRKQNSEFAPSYTDTIESIGEELAIMARDVCRDDQERRALLAGLMAAFQRMYRGNPQLAQRITHRLGPRILQPQPSQDAVAAWTRIPV